MILGYLKVSIRGDFGFYRDLKFDLNFGSRFVLKMTALALLGLLMVRYRAGLGLILLKNFAFNFLLSIF